MCEGHSVGHFSHWHILKKIKFWLNADDWPYVILKNCIFMERVEVSELDNVLGFGGFN